MSQSSQSHVFTIIATELPKMIPEHLKSTISFQRYIDFGSFITKDVSLVGKLMPASAFKTKSSTR